MADLAKALADLAGDGMTVFQAVVSAVGTGVVDLTYNGGTYTAVPYIAGGFAPATAPAVGNQVYVIGRKDWGGLVIGKAPAGPTRSNPAVTTDDWDPYALAAYNRDTKAWTIAGGDLTLTPETGTALGSMAVAFFRPVDTPFTTSTALGTATVHLSATAAASLELGMHTTATPTGTLVPRSEHLTVRLKAGQTLEAPIPLAWVTALLSGAAQGITARPLGQAVTLSGPGIVHLTSL